MKKTSLTLLMVVLFIGTTQAQWFNKHVRGNLKVTTVTRNVSNYDAIGVGGSFDVKLVSGKEGKITITAEENLIPYLITDVENGHLKIKWEKGVSVNHLKRILVEVPVEAISKLSLAGSGDVFTDNFTLKGNDLSVSLAGSGDIKIAVKMDHIRASIAGSGDIRLNGQATNYDASIAGSGDISSYDLNATNATVRITGSGGVKTSVTDMLNVKITGSGDVYYKGNPKQDVKITGSGGIHSKM